MDEILADGMEPAMPPPLAENVILAIEVDRAVYVVDPAFAAVVARLDLAVLPIAGREMELRPQRLVIQRLDAGCLDCNGLRKAALGPTAARVSENSAARAISPQRWKRLFMTSTFQLGQTGREG